MNKKGLISILLPLFAIVILATIILVITATHTDWDEDTHPTIGEKQEAVLNAYSQADAMRIYARQAAKQAINEASKTATREELEQAIQTRYGQLLAAYQQQPIYATPQVTIDGRDVTLELEEAIRIPFVYGNQQLPTRTTTAPFTIWPVNEPPVLTSLFGNRELESSPQHAGIDIRAPLNTEVISIDDGEVISVGGNNVFVEMTNGYTCGYFHVQPLADVGDVVARGQTIARVKQDAHYAPHLDLRCYNHEQQLTTNAAKEFFGESHVAQGSAQSADTTFVSVDTRFAPERAYIDPFCLLSRDLQQTLITRIQTDNANREQLSGELQHRNQSLDLPGQLYQTCDAYTQHGLTGQVSDVGQHYLQAALDKIIANEGTTCSDDEVDRGGRTKYGVTYATLANWRDISEEQARREVCNLTREEAHEIFLTRYLQEPGIDALPAELIPHVWDMSVHHGQGTASRLLQEVLVEKGHQQEVQEQLTPIPQDTLQAAQQAVRIDGTIYAALTDRRKNYIEAIIEGDATQERFRDGWMARAERYNQAPEFTGGYAQGTYSFSLEIHEQIPREENQLITSRTTLRNQLERCEWRDETCKLTELYHSPYSTCSEPAIELTHVLETCADQLETGCSCQLPLPQGQEANLTRTLLHLPDQTLPADWLQQGGDGRYEVLLRYEEQTIDSLNQQTISSINFLDARASYTREESTTRINAEQLYYRADIFSGADATYAHIYVSPTNQSALCEQTYKQPYCTEDDQRLIVEHPLASP